MDMPAGGGGVVLHFLYLINTKYNTLYRLRVYATGQK